MTFYPEGGTLPLPSLFAQRYDRFGRAAAARADYYSGAAYAR